ncbi:MAG: hypothetical protein HON33_02300, partial [Flavobacteriaceae bacterium]|nr:hypothetical protein [Flavobacteriaceae bacterium]
MKEAKHIESKVSNITTNWSAQAWGPELIARDIGANFFDGCIESKLPMGNNNMADNNRQANGSSSSNMMQRAALRRNGGLNSRRRLSV